MRSSVFLSVAGLVIACVVASAQLQQTRYLMPPKPIADMMDAEYSPAITLSPDRQVMLLSHQRSMPSIAEIAAPRIVLGEVNVQTNGYHTPGGITGLTLRDIQNGAERRLALPVTGRFQPSFSPDGRKLAITHTTHDRIRLLVADVASGEIREVLSGGLNGLVGGCSWKHDSTGFLCWLVPEGRGAAPEPAVAPSGPRIQESAGRPTPSRTYQDVLTSVHDEQLFEYYFTSQPTWVSTGRRRRSPRPRSMPTWGLSSPAWMRPPTASTLSLGA